MIRAWCEHRWCVCTTDVRVMRTDATLGAWKGAALLASRSEWVRESAITRKMYDEVGVDNVVEHFCSNRNKAWQGLS